MKRLLGGAVSLLVATTFAAVIWAGDISPHANGRWLAFSFRTVGTPARGCSPADPAGLGCALLGFSTQADAPPWTFVVGPCAGAPCGDPALPRAADRAFRRAVVEAALRALATPADGPTLFESSTRT